MSFSHECEICSLDGITTSKSPLAPFSYRHCIMSSKLPLAPFSYWLFIVWTVGFVIFLPCTKTECGFLERRLDLKSFAEENWIISLNR